MHLTKSRLSLDVNVSLVTKVLDGSNAMSKLQLPMPPPGMVGHPMFTYNRGHSPYPVQPDAFMIAAECW